MEIYFEKKHDHYFGDDVTITIHHNSRGSGWAEYIANEIQKIDGKQPLNNVVEDGQAKYCGSAELWPGTGRCAHCRKNVDKKTPAT